MSLRNKREIKIIKKACVKAKFVYTSPYLINV